MKKTIPYIPRTSWAKANNPYTKKVIIKMGDIPVVPKQRKGHTKYDEEFSKLLGFKKSIIIPIEGMDTIRRALQRFIGFRNLKGKVTVRQKVDKEHGTMTMWMEKNELSAGLPNS